MQRTSESASHLVAPEWQVAGQMTNTISTYLWPGRVEFGPGTVTLVAQAARDLDGTHALVVADRGVIAAGLLEPVVQELAAAGLPYTLFDGVVPNPDIASIGVAAARFRDCGADVLIGIGGGSALDTAKAAKLLLGGPPEATIWEYATLCGESRRPLPSGRAMPPFIAIPTTAGTGAEATPWAVITHPQRRLKFGVGDATTLPDVALVDPDLTLSLPSGLTAATGMDALTHLIEAYVSTNQHPLLDPLILHGIRLVGRSLRPAVQQGDDRAARQDMMAAALIGGIAISSKWLGACHSLAHPLSALGNLHHGLACAIMLPHQMAYNLDSALERYAEIAVALCGPTVANRPVGEQAQAAVTAVQELLRDVGLPRSLSAAGVSATLIPTLAAAAYTDLNWQTNPCYVDEAAMAAMYRAAL